jgi:hypothetical protein
MGLLDCGKGRPPNGVIYKDISYKGKEYVVGYISSKGETVKFIVDKDNYEEVSKYSWHRISNNYIATSFNHDQKRKSLYLHNLVMNRHDFLGKGQAQSIDHINRNGFDNRKENLRLLSQSDQNMNQATKKRSVVLPEGFPLKPEDIPKHIWYVRKNGLHGDRFAIEFKTEGIVWKTTSSTKVSITDKLAQAKQKLAELYAIYPHLNPSHSLEESEKGIEIYNEIIAIADAEEQ